MKSAKGQLDLISEFSKVPGYKINIYKSGTFLFISNYHNKWKTMTFTSTSKTVKYLGIYLTKLCETVHGKNNRALLRDINYMSLSQVVSMV